MSADDDAMFVRSIPACAGEPPGEPAQATAAEVYPRVCGGTHYRQRFDPGAEGLSPRVRGNQTARAAVHPRRGSIPACAGEPIS